MFLMREVASRNGETALIEPYHLLEALIREDQGEFAARMPNVVAIAGKPKLRPHPFFSEGTATAVLVKLERIFRGKPNQSRSQQTWRHLLRSNSSLAVRRN